MQTYPFVPNFVNVAPLEHGVYLLFAFGELIYIGRAFGLGVTIRSRLQSHLAGWEGPCTQAATDFSWLISFTPATDEAMLLAEYKRQHGRLPRCNDRIG